MEHRARKRFGQNFLIDEQVVDRILAAIGPAAGQRIIEIGPGHAALTADLAESGADLQLVLVVGVDLDDLEAGLGTDHLEQVVVAHGARVPAIDLVLDLAGGHDVEEHY